MKVLHTWTGMCARSVILRGGACDIKAIWGGPKHSPHVPWVEESESLDNWGGVHVCVGGCYEVTWGALLNGGTKIATTPTILAEQ